MPLKRLHARLRWARSLSKGIQRGDVWPSAGRTRPVDAPQGTVRQSRRAGPLARLRAEVGWFEEVTHTLEAPGLEQSVDILHLTDVHLREPGAWLDSLCDNLRRLRPPDLIVITGDLVTRGWTSTTVDAFLSSLPRSRLGAFAILGNWEHWSGATGPTWRSRLADHGVRLLVNECAWAGPLRIFGSDDHLAGEPDLRSLHEPSTQPTLVLTHSPAHFPAVAGDGVVAVLSGHTHGGQVRVPWLGVPWVPRGSDGYVGGWYRQGATWLHVSPGLGWSIAPVRMWCPPELSRVVLKPRYLD